MRTNRHPPGQELLRWYPAAWRQRYGEEFAALMEDSLQGQPPTPRFRLSIVRAGLRERGHEAGLLGHGTTEDERVRGGSLLVLCAWSAVLVAGGMFANTADNFKKAVPASSRSLATFAYGAVVVLAIVGALVVLTGALVALPAFLRFLRLGGWSSIRRPVRRAVGMTVVSAVALVGLSTAAHHLTTAQRTGGSWIYSLAFVVTGIVGSVTLALWTVAGVAAIRRCELSRAVLRSEAVLAGALGAVMALLTAAAAVWWAAVASAAPWFLHGTRPGSGGSPFGQQLTGSMALMLLATLVAVYGVSRMARGWRHLPAA